VIRCAGVAGRVGCPLPGPVVQSVRRRLVQWGDAFGAELALRNLQPAAGIIDRSGLSAGTASPIVRAQHIEPERLQVVVGLVHRHHATGRQRRRAAPRQPGPALTRVTRPAAPAVSSRGRCTNPAGTAGGAAANGAGPAPGHASTVLLFSGGHHAPESRAPQAAPGQGPSGHGLRSRFPPGSDDPASPREVGPSRERDVIVGGGSRRHGGCGVRDPGGRPGAGQRARGTGEHRGGHRGRRHGAPGPPCRTRPRWSASSTGSRVGASNCAVFDNYEPGCTSSPTARA